VKQPVCRRRSANSSTPPRVPAWRRIDGSEANRVVRNFADSLRIVHESPHVTSVCISLHPDRWRSHRVVATAKVVSVFEERDNRVRMLRTGTPGFAMSGPTKSDSLLGTLAPTVPAIPTNPARRRTWPIVVTYAIVATLWIYFSDQQLVALSPTPALLLKWSVYKGLGFVAVTSVVLLIMLRWSFGKIELAYAALLAKELRLSASEAQLSGVVSAAMDAIITVDADKRIRLFNPAAQRIFACDSSQALEQPISRFLPKLAEQRETSPRLLRGVRWDGAEFPIEASISWTQASHGVAMTAVLRDISQRVLHEAQNERLQRLYTALAQVSQAIVSSKSDEMLFESVCRVLVEHGGFGLAWVGTPDLQTEHVVPLTYSANSDGFKDINLDGLPPSKRFLCAVFRDGVTRVCNDLVADQASAWRSEYLPAQLRAAAVFVVRRFGVPHSVLTLYAEVVDFFQDRETALLSEMTLDVSLALDSIAQEQARRDAEVALEREKQFSDTMIESMPGIVYFYDAHGRFLRWNKNFERVSGFIGAEVAVMHSRDFFLAEDHGALDAMFTEVMSRGESSLEAQFVAKDGSATPYFFTHSRVNFGEMQCLIGAGIDVSQQKRAQRELRNSEERYRTLNAELDNRNRELQDFAFVASHDLQEPLRKIRMFSDVLVNRHREELSAQAQNYLDRVSQASARMQVLIDDLLSYSRVATVGKPFVLVDLDKICGEVLVDLDSRIESCQARIKVQKLPTIQADATQMRQLFQNLLANALKFHFPDRIPEITITCEQVRLNEAPAWRIDFVDNGIGFDAKFADRLFNAFMRLHARTEYEGTGMGLAIVRRIVERHRGTIEATGEIAKGAHFTVVLPIARHKE